MKKKTDWIETFTGKKFYPLEPDKDLIDIEDIAHALSFICRFNGHAPIFYSVAEHSLYCLYIARELNLDKITQLQCLMHDASEAYISDIPRPIKKYLPKYKDYENKLLDFIFEKYKIPKKMPAIVKEIDTRMLKTECVQLFKPKNNWASLDEIKEYSIKLKPIKNSKKLFLKEFFSLSNKITYSDINDK